MLACARVGAVHSVVFGGFAANELARRIDHAEVNGFLYSALRTTTLVFCELISVSLGFPSLK